MDALIRLVLALVMSIPGPSLPDGYILEQATCPDTLAMVQARLPVDYGTRWQWSNLTPHGASGSFFRDRDLIIISTDIECRWVPIVALHEWFHQVQDVTGVRDGSTLGGFKRMEIVADCAARVLADHYGWEHFASYPELSKTPCSSVVPETQDLLSLI